jgi:hypothetical protein
MCFAHSKFVSEHQPQRKYTKLGCMCRCIICKYGNLTFSYSRFFCSIITHHMHIVSYVEHSSASNPPGVQCSKHSVDRPTISNFRFLSFYYLYNNTKLFVLSEPIKITLNSDPDRRCSQRRAIDKFENTSNFFSLIALQMGVEIKSYELS